MNTRILLLAAALFSALSIFSAVQVAQASANPCQRVALSVVANGHESLSDWLIDNQQPLTSVLHYSFVCNGGFLSRWFGKYINQQNDRLVMRQGTHFWAQWPQD